MEQKNKLDAHDGHRERMREKFLHYGIDKYTPPHEVLEMLLFYAIPRKNTNPIAHALINRFGSLSGVLDASIDELCRVEGVGRGAATLLKMIMPIARVYNGDKLSRRPKFKNLDDIGDFILKKYEGLTEEKASVLLLDGAGDYLGFEFIAEGDISSVGLSVRDLIKIAMKYDASNIVLAHNHPSGIAIPSANDVRLTEMIAETFSHIEINLLDHMIMGTLDFVSMVQSAEYSHIFFKKK